ncbi:biotin/lipoyl-binding protein, partial [Patescibacteria group bacterium]|nr:biotin/lipoyl-binding protein [Patescibacteria group bacterium]
MENTQASTPLKKKSIIPKFLKKKRYYIIAIILLLVGYLFWQQKNSAGAITYETAQAEQGTLLQTVEVTGEIRPAARIDLAFETAGTLTDVKVKVGDSIKKGDLLAVLQDTDLAFAERRAAAALALYQANLNARLAGESDESIQVTQAQYDQAVSSYKKALSDLENTKIQVQNDLENAKIALETSKNNLDNASPLSDQSLENAIESARVALKSSVGSLNSALIEGDAIIGVDDTASNQYYESILGIGDDGSVQAAENQYKIAKANKLIAEAAI